MLAGALRARERAVILPAVQSLRLACWEGTIACWVARVRSLAIPGLYGGGWLGGASTEPRVPGACTEDAELGLSAPRGLVRRAGRRTPCARESCDSDSSPEPAAGLLGGDDCLLGGASTEPRDPRLVRRGLVGWREYGTSRARSLYGGRRAGAQRSQGAGSERGLVGALRARERAVILPAVQSLRLACWEGTIACWVARVRSLAIPGRVRRGACWVVRARSLECPGWFGEGLVGWVSGWRGGGG
jgi:hypothetical protein